MTTPPTFCCVVCRLLQPPTPACVDCGESAAPLELVRELLYYRDMSLLSHRDWGLIAGLLAGSSLALPILAPFAVGSVLALCIQKLRDLRHRSINRVGTANWGGPIAGIALPPPTATPGATTWFGVARRFRATVRSVLDDSPLLIEHAVVRDPRGAVLLRRCEVAPFLLEVDSRGYRGPVLVTGVARMAASAHVIAQRVAVRRGDPRLARMGIPADLAVTGELEVASVSADGPGVAVTGITEDEVVAELAFHRDGGQIPVIRGRAGAPIIVEDPRLVAVGL